MLSKLNKSFPFNCYGLTVLILSIIPFLFGSSISCALTLIMKKDIAKNIKRVFIIFYLQVTKFIYCLIFLNALINPLVDESCVVTPASLSNSGNIFFASCLPNSTPHWSKL